MLHTYMKLTGVQLPLEKVS